MRPSNLCLGLAALLLLTGCAFENKSLAKFDGTNGYRLSNLRTNTLNSDEVFIVLAFSGGGTRAAAFSYGTLKQLAETPIHFGGPPRRLLDEVDVISSVSGGSFTAAYYALYGDRLFTDFSKDFLYRNVELGLGLRVLNPLNWPRLASPYFDRIDLAAEYYDSLLFQGHTYQDLVAAGRRPYIILNATDMSQGSQFEFVQDQFDLLYSDLGSYPLARAVAASSAFPILLSPLTMKNYVARPGYQQPGWITAGLRAEASNSQRYHTAVLAHSYEDATRRPYIHLLDGGLSDNLGLGGPTRELLSNDRSDSILNLINFKKIKVLAFISVNAKPGVSLKADLDRQAPGLLGVFSTVTSAPMDNSSLQSSVSLSESITQFIKDQKAAAKAARAGRDTMADVDYFNIELKFDDIQDPQLRQQLESLPTSFALDPASIQLLENAAATLLKQSTEFGDLVRRLQ